MKNWSYLVLVLSFLTSTPLFAQQRVNTSTSQENKTIHYYSFEAKNTNQDVLNNLEETLSRFDFVTQAKVKYKPENGMGQIIVLVTQPLITSENQAEFQPTQLKKTLINFGFTPIQYSKEPYVIK